MATPAQTKTTRTIHVDYLARVEGEGAMKVRIQGDQVTHVELRIFEPPRFFEAFLRGRAAAEAPDITARICGICPVAYQMSAVHAIEDALGVRVDGALRALRRLLYCGEWIESHTLHAHLLHAPDFLGLPDAITLAQQDPAAVQRGLRLKKAGNAIVALLGGREIHPINVRIGGFYKVPHPRDFAPLREQLLVAREDALATVRWVAGFSFPDLTRDYEFVSLRHPGEYPMNEGRVVSSAGLDIAPAEFDAHFVEEQVPHSHALHARLRERGGYLVGPLARYSLNFDRLSPLSQEAAREAGLGPTCRNPFQAIIVRAVEVLYACGNPYRRDDGVGRAVARLLAEGSAACAARGVRVIESDGGLELLDAWQGAERAVLIDAVHGGAAPGAIHVLRAEAGPLPATLSAGSSHALGVAQAVELGRAPGAAPPAALHLRHRGRGLLAGGGADPPRRAGRCRGGGPDPR
jgi:hydrogenase maturation protease